MTTLVPPKILSEDDLLLLSSDEQQVYLDLLERYVALQSPLDYACYISPETIRYAHIERLNEEILALCEYRLYADGPGPKAVWYYQTIDGHVTQVDSLDDIPFKDVNISSQIIDWWGEHPETKSRVLFKLAIVMPPRHGKSWLTTLHTPAWFLARWPDKKVVVATYSDDFASEWGEQVQEQLESERSLVNATGTRVSLRVKDHKGELRFVGTGGKLTGTGFHLGIIDDPVKNAEEAMSKAERDRKDNWYGSTFARRKEPGAVEIMMFTRWHEDDLSGRRVYSDDGLPRPDWRVLHLRAISTEPDLGEEPDLLGREPGEALCPPRFNITQLREIQEQDPLWFDAQYQGDPSVSAGKTIDTSRMSKFLLVGDQYLLQPRDSSEEERPFRVDDCKFFASIDLAATTKKWSDWSVVGIFAWHPVSNVLFLTHLERLRIESSEHVRWVTEILDRHRIQHVGIEKKTYGLTLIQNLRKENRYHLYAIEPDTDKVSRALPLGAAINNGLFAVPDRSDWYYLFERELKSFPNSRFDDQVDTAAYALYMLPRLPRGVIPGGARREKSLAQLCMEQALREQARSKGLGGIWGDYSRMVS